MSEHMDRAISLADKITTKAEETLADLKLEMEIRKWPPDFRKIVWGAVSHLAATYAESEGSI